MCASTCRRYRKSQAQLGADASHTGANSMRSLYPSRAQEVKTEENSHIDRHVALRELIEILKELEASIAHTIHVTTEASRLGRQI